MSNPYLPPELLDCIVDLLHDNQNALKQCCLVSKSWVPRTREHLFTDVNLDAEEHLELWKTMFPDPSISPAQFAKSLHIGCPRAVTVEDAEPGGWLTGFVHIVHLGVETQEVYPVKSPVSLAPFHRFSPIIKSLLLKSAALPPSWIFNFILSSPLLEDLTVASYGTLVDDGGGSDSPLAAIKPSDPPLLTGSLELPLEEAMGPIAGRLLSMSGGINFRKLTLNCCRGGDLSLAMALVGECSHTLESLDVTCNSCGTSIRYLRPLCGLTSILADWASISFDLSKATRLKDLTFRTNSWHTGWVTVALRTITPDHRGLRQISISPVYFSAILMLGVDAGRYIGEQTLVQWSELDRLLSQLRESHSIPPMILCDTLSLYEVTTRDVVGSLLPETTGGGTINLVDVP